MQILYFIIFLLILTAMIFAFHLLRTRSFDGPYLMILSFLWVLSFATGHLGYKLQFLIPLGTVDVRYSSSIYILIFVAILLVYICEGVHETQNLIMVCIGMQIVLAVTQIFLGVIAAPILKTIGRPENYKAALIMFKPSYWKLTVSIIATVVDLYFAVFIFQFMVNRFKKMPMALIIFLALSLTMALDSLIFVGGTRFATFWKDLHSHLVLKTTISAFITIPFTIYLRWFQTRGHLDLKRGSLDIFKRIEGLEEALKKANIELRDYADTLELKVEERTKELKQTNNELLLSNKQLREARRIAERDMRMAVNVQSSFLPESYSDKSEWDIAFTFQPMSGVSGDFYDFYEFDGTLRGVGIFDVSGHGISSGLITVIAKSIIFRHFQEGYNDKLNLVLQKINKNLINEIGHTGNYLTGILLRFNENSVEYVNAGHTDLLVKRAASGKVSIVDSKKIDWRGWFLGIEMMKSNHKVLRLHVETGDSLLLFSDCIVECKNYSSEQYGAGRLMESLRSSDSLSAKEIMDQIINEFFRFTGTDELTDDLTVLVLKRK